jgi:hypothetical protein
MLEFIVLTGRNTVNIDVKFPPKRSQNTAPPNSVKYLSRTKIRLKNSSLHRPKIIKNEINISVTKLKYLVFILKFL